MCVRARLCVCVCVCVFVKFLLPKQLKHTHPLSSVLQLEGEGGCGGGDEKPSVFQASINELKLISESYWQTKCPLISLPSLSLSLSLSLCDTVLFGKGQL